MATGKKRTSVTGQAHEPSTLQRRSKTVERYRSDTPAGVDQPGTGQPGDEIVTPAERERAEELVDEAIEAGAVTPPQPLGIPAEASNRSGTGKDTEREVEDQLNHAGIEDEPDPHEDEHAPSNASRPSDVGTEQARPTKWSDSGT